MSNREESMFLGLLCALTMCALTLIVIYFVSIIRMVEDIIG